MKYSGAAVQGLAILMGMDRSSAEKIRDQHNEGHDMTDWINHGLRKDRSTDCEKCEGKGYFQDFPETSPDLSRECERCRGTGHAHACSACGIVDKLNDGSCAFCDADIPVRPE